MTMANQAINPFEDEKPQLVHLEKDQSHYEYCRMQMHDIEHVHRRTFFCNLGLCIFVCLLAVFHVYVGGFDLLSGHGIDTSRAATVITVGIFQIVSAMIIIVLGYLAWANYRILNIILEMWYVIVTIIGIVRLDYMTGLVGAVGIVFYYFSILELRKEESLAQMEGYPEFHEKLDITKSDYVVQTLLAHKGEHLVKKKKSSVFSTDYSLRKAKKRKDPDAENGHAGEELAATLQKKINEVQNAKDDAKSEPAAEPVTGQTAEAKPEPAAEAAAPAAAEMQDLTEEKADPFTDADAIMAEAEARAKEILAEAVAKAQSLKTDAPAPAQAPAPKKSGGKKKRR